ncbi:hypothetical protein [Pedobacter sp. MW01-1-1]|uniref:hypothetical protein n=1 Tax=Pedobacter sp. MW01-1-1 TaxID=3383027 RepID=UPI003FEF569E
MKKNALIITISVLVSFIFFNASAQWTTAGNDIYNTSQGKVSIGTTLTPAKFTVFESNYLGHTVQSKMLLSSIRGAGGNIFQHNTWLVRNTAGTDWLSVRIHDGISVDVSYLDPQVNTRTWWERDPHRDIQLWGTGPNTYMTLRAGKLGIGTTAPAVSLTVQQGDAVGILVGANSGTQSITNHTLKVGRIGVPGLDSISRPTSIAMATSDIGSNILSIGGGSMFMNAATITHFYAAANSNTASGTIIASITNSGLGIGTTDTKGYKLAVNGSMIATEMKVKAFGTWPDFVFSPTYKLRSLADVARYINKYQHLPEVPSADEIEKEGLDVGKMNAVLMKKVEELTLYLIQQETRMKEMEERLKKMESSRQKQNLK